MRFHSDERRLFYGDIFETPNGDINVVYPTKGVPIGWHRHQHQDDHLFLVSGLLLVRSFEEGCRKGWENVLLPGQNPVVIDSNTWHGYEALEDDTIVLQFNGPGKWDGSDEERMSFDKIPWIPTP